MFVLSKKALKKELQVYMRSTNYRDAEKYCNKCKIKQWIFTETTPVG